MDFWLMVNIAGGILLAASAVAVVGGCGLVAVAFFRASLERAPSLRVHRGETP